MQSSGSGKRQRHHGHVVRSPAPSSLPPLAATAAVPAPPSRAASLQASANSKTSFEQAALKGASLRGVASVGASLGGVRGALPAAPVQQRAVVLVAIVVLAVVARLLAVAALAVAVVQLVAPPLLRGRRLIDEDGGAMDMEGLAEDALSGEPGPALEVSPASAGRVARRHAQEHAGREAKGLRDGAVGEVVHRHSRGAAEPSRQRVLGVVVDVRGEPAQGSGDGAVLPAQPVDAAAHR